MHPLVLSTHSVRIKAVLGPNTGFQAGLLSPCWHDTTTTSSNGSSSSI
jgi:hypothetical protein